MLRIFLQMTVLKNPLVGHRCHIRYRTPAAIVGLPSVWRAEGRIRDEMTR